MVRQAVCLGSARRHFGSARRIRLWLENLFVMLDLMDQVHRRSRMCLVGGMSEEFVSGGPHAERERFSSPEVPLLGGMSEGVHFMLSLGML